MRSYPIELDLTGRRVVVIGLGSVGFRKASSLVEAGACVIGVDPAPVAVIPGVDHFSEPYRPEQLAGASLVFAASTPDLNRQVVDDARALGIWVNSASDPVSGDFSVPASWRDGPLTLTVSTSGASPALATVLRDRAVLALGPNAATLTQLLAALRPEVLSEMSDPATRREALARLSDPRWLDHLDAYGPEPTRLALRLALGLPSIPPPPLVGSGR